MNNAFLRVASTRSSEFRIMQRLIIMEQIVQLLEVSQKYEEKNEQNQVEGCLSEKLQTRICSTDEDYYLLFFNNQKSTKLHCFCSKRP